MLSESGVVWLKELTWLVRLGLLVPWVLGQSACAGAKAEHEPPARAPALSCEALPKTCGALGGGDCCESMAVPGGSFLRNSDAALPASVSGFRLDKYEVTVGRFRKFLDAYEPWRASGNPASGSGAHPRIAASGWDPVWTAQLPDSAAATRLKLRCDRTVQAWTDEPGENETRPINCVSWYEALAFCAWDGGRLPTLAEWNFAAAGGGEQREYPWSVPPESTTITPEHASYYSAQIATCLGDGQPNCGLTDLVPVGSKPLGDGKYGQADLAGNVREWVLDGSRAFPNPCVDCANLETIKLRALRGGAWNNLEALVTTAAVLEDFPENHYFVIGMRCARD